MYLIIADHIDGNPTKIAYVNTEDQAQSKVSELKDKGYNKAFYAVKPETNDTSYITVNADNTISVDYDKMAEYMWDDVRNKRDMLLTASDWSVLTDAPLTSAQKTDYKTYRQALRDVPQDFTNPEDVVWPDKPS